MGQSSVTPVVQAGKEPPAVFRVDKVTFSWTDIWTLRDWPDLRGSITWSSLGWPDTYLPTFIKDEASWTSVFKNGVVVFELVELDTSVELGAVFWIPVVSLASTSEGSLGVLSQAGNLSFSVNNPDNPEWRNTDSWGQDWNHILSSCNQILLQTVDNQLPGSPVQSGHSSVDRPEQRVGSISTMIVNIIGIDAKESNTSKVAQECILGLDLQAGGIVKCHPALGIIKGIWTSHILVPFYSPVALLQSLANLSNNQS